MRKKRRLSNVDTAWRRMDDPANLMMVTAVAVLGAPLDLERFLGTLERGLAPYDRFRQRVVASRLCPGRYNWVEQEGFALDDHVTRLGLAPPADREALEEVVSDLASRALDPDRPLWHVHVVEGYGPGCALICRFHHCIGDGFALVHVLLSLTDADPEAALAAQAPERRAGHVLPRGARRAVLKKKRLVQEGWGLVVHPSRLVRVVETGARGAVAAGRLVLRRPDPQTVLKGELGQAKRAAWSEPIALADVKAAGRGLGGTVNDVLLAAVSGALRRYLQERGELAEGADFRAIVPVNLRPPDAEPELGNRFGLVFLSLPVGVAGPLERLAELKRRMDTLKGSLEAPVAFGILNVMGLAPPRAQALAVEVFGSKGTAVMTNVKGPTEPVYLAGSPLESLMFWVPQSGRLGMGVSILSYSGRVWLGVITDEGLVPDPEEIIAGFQAEFEALRSLALGGEVTSGFGRLLEDLDGVERELDSILEARGQEAGEREATTAEPGPCQALTRAGQPCKNRAVTGSGYCRVHQEYA